MTVVSLWAAPADLRVVEWRCADASEEFTGARWADGYDEPAGGAEFVGSNTHKAIGDARGFANVLVKLFELNAGLPKIKNATGAYT